MELNSCYLVYYVWVFSREKNNKANFSICIQYYDE